MYFEMQFVTLLCHGTQERPGIDSHGDRGNQIIRKVDFCPLAQGYTRGNPIIRRADFKFVDARDTKASGLKSALRPSI